jgi:TolB-like protein/Flp pilus assembly protein TadD
VKNPFTNIQKRQIWRTLVAYPAAAFVILQAVDFFISKYDLNPKTLTFSLILLIGGFIISLLWNWNHGEKGIQKFSNKEKVAYAIVIVTTLMCSGYYWSSTPDFDKTLLAINSEISNKLAVLPFENKAADSSLTYLSEGVPENLINRLSKTTNFRVLSRNSTFILDESDKGILGVKKKLGADLLLTGRIEKLNNQLVVSCELINVSDGTQIWGDKLFYDDKNIIELEQKLVNSLLKSLPTTIKTNVEITNSEASTNPEAQSHFMKGRALSYGSTTEESEKALAHFRKAIEIDPKFASAYVAIANEKIIQALFSTATREEIFNEARTAVQTALAFDPNSSEAYYVDGAIKFYGNFDWKGAETSYKKSIELNPNSANAYIRYSAFLGAMKKHDKSILMANKAIALDPISISSLHNLGWVQLIAGNFKESEDAFSEALSLHPNWIWGYMKRGYTRFFQNKCELAEADASKAKELIGEWGSELIEMALIYIYTNCNNVSKRTELVKKFFEHVNEDNYEDPFAVAYVYYLNGELETALDWMERSWKEKEASSYLINIDVFYKNDILTHPRFIKLRKDMKFP